MNYPVDSFAKNVKHNTSFLFLILILSIIPCIQIATHTSNIFGFLSWIIAICFYISTTWRNTKVKPLFSLETKDYLIIGSWFFIFLSSIFLINQLFPNHFHWDEFVTAYTSITLPKINEMDWFGGYPKNGMWVAQFPVIFFMAQKLFFYVFGISVQVVRFSVWPYHMVSFFYLYLLSKLLMNRKFATLTLCVFTFLAANQYIGALGVHFHSSTAFYIGAIFHFIKTVKDKSVHHGILTNVWMYLCLMTYTSSYAILPFIFSSLLLEYFMFKNIEVFRNLIPGFKLFLILISPYIFHAVFIKNIFTDRTDQVNMIWGTWGELTAQNLIFFLRFSNKLRKLSAHCFFQGAYIWIIVLEIKQY